MNVKKILSKISLLMLFLSPLCCFSQQLEVVDFHEDAGRIDALREPVLALDSTPCGLIRLGLVHSSVEFGIVSK